MFPIFFILLGMGASNAGGVAQPTVQIYQFISTPWGLVKVAIGA